MSNVTLDASVSLVTIENVEIVTVGEWNASTGPCTFTPELLAAAVAALDDQSVKAPRLRIGHTDPGVDLEGSAGGFKEQPAFGRFVNLRLDETGSTIVADIAGVPAWLADILPAAYPSRSVEAYFNVTTAAGRKHDMVISSVALLGVSMPAVETLEDLRLAYGAEAPEGLQLQFVSGDRVAATRGGAMPERVSASVAFEDVRISFFDDLAQDDRYWWWIYKPYITPAVMIADDDEGGYWACPYTVSGKTVSWGEPYEVEMQWVAKDGGKVVASAPEQTARPERVFASAAESRPKDRVRAESTTKEDTMPYPSAVLEELGLDETADDDAVLEAIKARGEAPAPTGDDEGDGDGEGKPDEKPAAATAAAAPVNDKVVSIDKARLERLERDADEGVKARRAQLAAQADQIVDAAKRDGRIAPASVGAWRNAILPKDATALIETETAALAALAKGRIPVDERGVAASAATEDADVDAAMRSWFPELKTQAKE